MYLKDLLKHDLRTQNADYVVRCIIRSCKSDFFKSKGNIIEIDRTIMAIAISDAAEDLKRTDEIAGKKMKFLLKYTKHKLDKDSFGSFKQLFFNLIRKSRESLWLSKTMKNKKAFEFKKKNTVQISSSVQTSGDDVVTVPVLSDVQQVTLPQDHPQKIKSFMNSSTLEKVGIRVCNNSSDSEAIHNPPLYGSIELYDSEKVALSLHPEMRVFEKLHLGKMDLEMEKGLAKVRWKDQKPSQNQSDHDQFTHSNLPFHCSGPVVRPLSEKNSIYFPSTRVTDLPTNRAVKLPDPLSSSEETKLLAFKTEVMETTKRYINENCAENGAQTWNLSSQQKEGILSLKRRIKEEDLVAMESDKSKKMTLMTMENYVQSTEPHTSGDQIISMEEMHHIERLLNAHTLQMARVFLICFNQGDMRRITSALINEDIEPTPLRSVRKDHKAVPLHLETLGPPSR